MRSFQCLWFLTRTVLSSKEPHLIYQNLRVIFKNTTEELSQQVSQVSSSLGHCSNKIFITDPIQRTDDLPTALILDMPHPTTPEFQTLLMEEFPPSLMRLQGFISRHSNFPSERLLKLPLVSPFDGCVTGKSLVCQVRMVPSMGTPMFDAMIDFLTGRPIDLPLLRSSINFALNKSQHAQRSLFVLSSSSESHEIKPDTTSAPLFEFGKFWEAVTRHTIISRYWWAILTCDVL